jgi:hypothetical protein
MTNDRDVQRLLDRWLTERPTQVADRVLDEVADRIARQRQEPGWRVARRDLHVNSYVKPLVAIAAVVVVAAAGITIIGRPSGSGVGGAAPPTASPSMSPSTAPSTSVVYPSWFTDGSPTAAGILPAGDVSTQAFRPGITFTAPEGWVNPIDDGDFFALFPDTSANQAEFTATGSLANEIFMGPHSSPYFVCDAWEDNAGTTAAEIVAPMLTNDALAMSEPIDVTIGGLTGKQFDVHLDPGTTETCPGDPEDFDLADGRTRGFLLDRPEGGVIVIFVTSLHSAGHDTFVAEAMPIIESFEFDLTP